MSSFSQLVRLLGRYGGYRLARALTQGQPRILMYHRFAEDEKAGYVSRERFRQQLTYVRRHYRPITLTQLANEVFEGQKLPPNTVVITIDDGYQDFYDIAWPEARGLDVPLTLFATTGFVNGDLWLWPDKVSWLLARVPSSAPLVEMGGLEFNADMVREHHASVWQHLIRHMLAIPDTEKHQAISELATKWDVELPGIAPPEFAACTWAQLLEMQEQGLEVGGHTVTHPSLGQVDENQAAQEIMGCMDMLTEQLGKVPRSFCYPNGMPGDYSDGIARMVEEAGFSCAVTAFADSLGISRRFALRRHAGSEDWFQFYKAISGIELLGHKYRRTLLEAV